MDLNPETIKNELRMAYQAQASGNDGLARVCARRAAGWAIQIHLKQLGVDLESPSALDHIKYLDSQQNNSTQVSKVLGYLQVKVAKKTLEEDSYWPLPKVDLVKEAHWLAELMLEEKIDIS
jgi:hypothetical protein